MSAPTTIYLVCSCGDYDAEPWVVCGYGDREQAELHANAVQAASAALPGRYQPSDADPSVVAQWDAARLLDPQIEGRMGYRVVEINLWRHFDEFQGL